MSEAVLPSEMPKLEPLKVHCTDALCEAGFHCFSPNRRAKDWQKSYEGECQFCGQNPVDWQKVKTRDLSDVENTFRELSRELIRHTFFDAPFDEKSKKQAHELGMEKLKVRVRPLLEKKIGPQKIFRDGTQTKKEGSAIFYAQHATATCCRKCLEYWYGIGRNRELTKEELEFCEGLVFAYLDLRRDELLARAEPDNEVETDVAG
jgi:hypothetical protein